MKTRLLILFIFCGLITKAQTYNLPDNKGTIHPSKVFSPTDSTNIKNLIDSAIKYVPLQPIPISFIIYDTSSSKIFVTFDTTLKSSSTPSASDFLLTGNSISSVLISGKLCVLTLSNPVSFGDILTLSYNKPSVGRLISTYGGEVSSFSNNVVVNNVVYINSIKRIFGNHIIGLWPLSETSGTSAIDSSSNAYNASYYNSPTLNQIGIYGLPSVDFKGTASLNVYSSGFLSKFSFQEGYIGFNYAANSDSTWGMASKNLFTFGASGGSSIYLALNGSYMNASYVYNSTYTNVISIPPLSGSKFFNVGLRWSKTSDTLSLFVNGVKYSTISTTLGTMTSPVLDASKAYIFGGQYGGTNAIGRGNAVYVLNYAPTDKEIFNAANPTGIINFEGDSRSANGSWIGQAANGASGFSSRGFGGRGYYASAVPGSSIASMAARASTTNLQIIPNKDNILVVWCGVNSYTLTPQQLYDQLRSYCENARASGWNKIVICTEIDSQDGVHGTWHTSTYQALNTLIRADYSFADAIADLGANANLQDASNTTYFNADKLHPIAAGYKIIGSIVSNALSTLKK